MTGARFLGSSTAVPADPALATALSIGGVLSCGSAAAWHDLELLAAPARVHVTIKRNRYAMEQPTGMKVHRRDVPSRDGVVFVERAVADCLRCMPAVAALVVVESALRRGVELDDVRAQLRGHGSARAAAPLALVDGRSGAVGETVARLLFWRHEIDALPQAYIAGVGWVDFLIDGWLVVEIDGFR